MLPAGFFVDAMGRPSRLADWLARDGYDRPPLERVRTGINYASARFKRPIPAEELDTILTSVAHSRPGRHDGVLLAVVAAAENGQWQLGCMGYDPARPGRTLDGMRALAGKLPPPFPESVADGPVSDITTFHQVDNRRRDFTAVTRFPARLVGIGDAVASFNPIFAQGMSSAALQASCLSDFLRTGPGLDAAATEFFARQKMVVDATWAVSARGDIARQEVLRGVAVAPDVRAQQAALADVVSATMVDKTVATAYRRVTMMLAHPDTLATPEIQALAEAAK